MKRLFYKEMNIVITVGKVLVKLFLLSSLKSIPGRVTSKQFLIVESRFAARTPS